jgi:8-oxo-dGTP diphosphatase
MKNDKFFNIRVYAFIMNSYEEVLIAEEFHYDTFMRKLPGGGLQFGEGIYDALLREIKEELNQEVESATHFHTTDFFVQSKFNESHQVVGVYYIVHLKNDISHLYRKADRVVDTNGEEEFKWKKIESLDPADFTFPVDQKAVEVFLSLFDHEG